MAIKLRIKELAEKKGGEKAEYGLSHIARRTGIGMTTMRRMYHGTASGKIDDPKELENVNLKILEKIAVDLGVEPCDLLQYTPDDRKH